MWLRLLVFGSHVCVVPMYIQPISLRCVLVCTSSSVHHFLGQSWTLQPWEAPEEMCGAKQLEVSVPLTALALVVLQEKKVG